jgi:hypothetical protein
MDVIDDNLIHVSRYAKLVLCVTTYQPLSAVAEQTLDAMEEGRSLWSEWIPILPETRMLLGNVKSDPTEFVADFSDEVWVQFRSKVLVGNFRDFIHGDTYPIQGDDPYDKGHYSIAVWSMRQGAHDLLTYKMEMRYLLLDSVEPKTLQQSLIDYGNNVFITFKACTGYVTLGWDNNRPYSDYEHNQLLIDDNLPDLRRWLRGCHWGNWLTDGHLAHLGGKDNVMLNAPCYSAIDMSSGDQSCVFIQASEFVDKMTREQLETLQHYISPVMPQGERRS